MPHRVLVVEPQCCEIEPAFTASLSENPDLCCEKVQWCDFCPEQLPRQSVDLLIAVAAPLTCDTAIHLQRLVEVSVGIPCLAVLPAGADDNLLRKVVKLATTSCSGPCQRLNYGAAWIASSVVGA